MQYTLDTNIVSELIRNPAGRAAQRARAAGDAACVSIIIAAELRSGCAGKGSPALLRRVEQFLSEVPVLPLTRRPTMVTASSELSWRPPASRSARTTC